MHTKVVYHAAKVFTALGIPVLRFNFRGVGLSEGTYDDGHGEQNDVRAALQWLELNFRKPILFAGFSFGANIGLRACCGDLRVKGLVGLGVPVRAEGRDYAYNFLPSCEAPKLFVIGGDDPFSPRDQMEALFHTAPEPRTLIWIDDADHFFQGTSHSPRPKLDEMKRALQNWLIDTYGL